MGLHDEIFEQPQVLQRILETQSQAVERAVKAVRQRELEFVFLVGRGTSDYAGIFAQYLWGSLNRLPVAFAAPSLFTVYAEPPNLRHALVVGISQSGQSPDVVQVLAEGRSQGALTLAVTNDTHSPLAETAEYVLDIQAGKEEAVAATKTYTAELMTLALFSATLSGDQAQLEALRQVPGAVEQVLKQDSQIEAIAPRQTAMRHCVVLGRGYNYATAWEWALKMKELAYVLAHPFSIADFQHGPIAVLEPGFPVLVVAPSGAIFEDMLASLRSITADLKVETLVISDREEALQIGQASIAIPAGLPEWLTPIVCIVPAQLYCYHLARSKGYNTDQPRTIHKVTYTR